jgi:hypothetical protein
MKLRLFIFATISYLGRVRGLYIKEVVINQKILFLLFTFPSFTLFIYTLFNMSTNSITIDSSLLTSNANNNNFSDKLNNVDFHTPAKIFQNKHAIHQFENITPDVSMPGTPLLTPSHHKYEYGSDASSVGFPSPSLPPTAVHTPPSLSPQNSDSNKDNTSSTPSSKPASINISGNNSDVDDESSPSASATSASTSSASLSVPHSATVTSLPGRPTTPSQFVFKRPQYNKEYHHTHFHHLEKKDTIFHDLKKFFKSDKSKKNEKGTKSATPSIKSNSELSFANEFNRDLEGKYGKWGK